MMTTPGDGKSGNPEVQRAIQKQLAELIGDKRLAPGTIVRIQFEHEGQSIETLVEIGDDAPRDIVGGLVDE